MSDPAKVLIIVENLSVPFDRRTWREAVSLADAGYRVSVISPRGADRDTAGRETIGGIEVFRYRPVEAASGLFSYLLEFTHALFMIFGLSIVVFLRRGFDVIQICNPPDHLFLATLPFKLLGKRVVFDHHDLSPELYVSKSEGKASRPVTRVLHALERLTFATADVVMSANESYRKLALGRGGKNEGDVFVVRNGPELARIRDARPDPTLKRGKEHLIVYLGMMGNQDGVDYLMRALRILAHDLGRDDFHALLMGGGPELEFLKGYARELSIEDRVTFTGIVTDLDRLFGGIASADVCVCPDPKIGLNDQSTMVKVLEYMSLGKPVVAFDLTETRASAGEGALYVTPNREDEFAARIAELLDSRELREKLGTIGRERIHRGLAWDHTKEHLLAAYRSAFAKAGKPSPA